MNVSANEGAAQFWIEFEFNRNVIEASDDIRNAIAAVRYKLPIEMREPVLRRFDPSAQPIMNVALSSTTQSKAEISRLAEDVLADRFRSIDGVSTVNVNGSLKRELSVLLRADKLREYNVSVSDVTNALQRQNTNAPVGKVRGSWTRRASAWSAASSIRKISRQVVVKRNGEQIVRLNQVADIRDGFADVDGLSIRSGADNVGIQVARTRDASTVTVAERCATWSTRSRRNCRKAPGSKSCATAARTPRTA
jgi:multidrug efflux pump subunit AcrB